MPHGGHAITLIVALSECHELPVPMHDWELAQPHVRPGLPAPAPSPPPPPTLIPAPSWCMRYSVHPRRPEQGCIRPKNPGRVACTCGEPSCLPNCCSASNAAFAATANLTCGSGCGTPQLLTCGSGCGTPQLLTCGSGCGSPQLHTALRLWRPDFCYCVPRLVPGG